LLNLCNNIHNISQFYLCVDKLATDFELFINIIEPIRQKYNKICFLVHVVLRYDYATPSNYFLIGNQLNLPSCYIYIYIYICSYSINIKFTKANNNPSLFLNRYNTIIIISSAVDVQVNVECNTRRFVQR